MIFVDSHSHLYDERLNQRADEIIKNFENDKIACTIIPSCDFKSMQQTLELSQKYNKVFSALGIHPHDAQSFDDNIKNFFKQHYNDDKVVALGEIGLDYFYDLSPHDLQKEVLEWQLDFSNKSNLPVIFHVRDAYPDFFDICRGNLIPKENAVLHCFGGNVADAKKGLDMGFYISFTCNITYKHSEILREVVDYVPLDRILIETDSPYMSPNHCRKEPNEPKNVLYVAEQIARQKGLSLENVGEQTTKNFFDLFKKAKI